MILDTYNQPKKITAAFLDAVVNHANEMLCLEDYDLDELQIVFKSTKGSHGYFDGIGDEDDGVASIEINSKNSVDEIVRTIFHELVHVQQVLNESFCDIEQTWHGEYYGNVEYDSRPWEIDAFEKESILYDTWKISKSAK